MYENILKPLKINNLIISNRIMASPMCVLRTDNMISSTYYGSANLYDKGAGGAGLVVVQPIPFSIHNKYERERFREMIYVCKQSGGKAAVEIEFGYDMSDEMGFAYGVSSGIKWDGKKQREMTREEIKMIIDKAAKEAKDYKDFGFDMAFISMGCDSMNSCFLAPGFNERTDEYGGSLENRCRFGIEALKAIREAVGPDYPIQVQVSRELKVPETYTPDDMLYFIDQIKPYFDMININTGMDRYGGSYDKFISNIHSVPTTLMPHNYSLEFAAEVKKRTGKLVSAVGSFCHPDDIEEALASGKVDAALVGRQLNADPYMPKKLKEGRPEDIVPCLRCNNCYCYTTEHKNVVCSVNPRYRRENIVPVKPVPAETKKRVVVVGGGPAGCKAALVLHERGHEVTLIEKSSQVGGLISVSDYNDIKLDLRRYRDYLRTQIKKQKINVLYDTTADKNLIRQINPDALVIAVGSHPMMPKIQGVDEEYVSNILDVYNGKKTPNGDVVIIGGGQTAVEFALEISKNVRKITIIEKLEKIAAGSNHSYALTIREKLAESPNIEVLTGTVCEKIEDHTVYTDHNFNGKKEIPADHVIVCTGFKPNRETVEELYGIVPETYEVGDCEKVASVCEATNYAYFIASNI